MLELSEGQDRDCDDLSVVNLTTPRDESYPTYSAPD